MRGIRSLVLAGVVACNMGELGDVSREWARISANDGGGYISVSSSTSVFKGLREQAADLIKRADQLEHREKTERRWRELVSACFPATGGKR